MWKEKNFPEIRRIYQRSSINMLLISLFIFGNVWLNVRDGLAVLHIQNEYATGIPALLLFGIIRIIDAGTGVNGQIIGASNFWRFEFVTGIIMLALRIPLSYIFIKRYGIIGSAYGDLISLSVYNYIRYDFLRRKFNMQPFTWKTVYSLLVGFAAYYITYYIFRMQTGWFAIVGRSVVFSSLLVAAIFAFRLTPDALQLYEVARKRLGWVK
jgi:O-antigen/teichoic acid export membrane protein